MTDCGQLIAGTIDDKPLDIESGRSE